MGEQHRDLSEGSTVDPLYRQARATGCLVDLVPFLDDGTGHYTVCLGSETEPHFSRSHDSVSSIWESLDSTFIKKRLRLVRGEMTDLVCSEGDSEIKSSSEGFVEHSRADEAYECSLCSVMYEARPACSPPTQEYRFVVRCDMLAASDTGHRPGDKDRVTHSQSSIAQDMRRWGGRSRQPMLRNVRSSAGDARRRRVWGDSLGNGLRHGE